LRRTKLGGCRKPCAASPCVRPSRPDQDRDLHTHRRRAEWANLLKSRAPQGTKLFTDGIYDGLFYRPTVLADAGPGPAAYDNEVFGPVALVTRFSTVDEAVELMAADSEYGLALGIMTADIATGFQIAEPIPTPQQTFDLDSTASASISQTATRLSRCA
jgi:acyl-CoA reductase-like NAD-dependent aldehyde dehydrogenase